MSLLKLHHSLICASVKRGGGIILPPYTLRFKANKAVTSDDFALDVTLTLVDEATHTYDLTYVNEDWASMFDAKEIGDNSWLIEVVDANLASVKSLANAFYGASNLVHIYMTDTSSVTKMSVMFAGCTSLTSAPLLDTSSVTDMGYMFLGCTSLTSVPLLDTSSVTDMGYMFAGCISLTSVPLLGTSSVTKMNSMFYECTSLTSVPLLDTSSVTDMGYMFAGCQKVESGALALYTQASTQANPPSTYSNAFTDCGKDTQTGLTELRQIPTSWGGFAA